MLAGFEVFDVHHHVGDASAVLGQSGGGGAGTAAAGQVDAGQVDAGQVDEVGMRLSIMDGAGVDQAAVIPGHGYLRADGLRDTQRINDDIAAYRDRHPARFPVAIGVIEPTYGPRSLPEIDRIKNELGLAGVSFHVRFQGVSLDSPWIRRYLERMVEIGLVPVLHAVHETSENPLWKVAALARSFPESPMLVLDAFGSFEGSKECFHTAELAPNLLFDTSLSYGFDMIERFIAAFGSERVVFGTDLYSYPLGRRISALLTTIAESSLDDAAKTNVLGANARRLFGVSTKGMAT